MRQDYTVNLPRHELEPLFPGYLFVQVDDKPFSQIDSTIGVMRLVRFGEQLAVVPQSVIDECDRISPKNAEDFHENDPVIVNSGSFHYIPAIFKAKKKDRIIVLMSILGQEQELTFNPSEIVAA